MSAALHRRRAHGGTSPHRRTSRLRQIEKLRVKSFYERLDFLDQLVRRLAGGVQP